MSTYGEIIANALVIVPRPEYEDLIRKKTNQVISYISKSGLFWRDIEEVTIGLTEGVDPATYIQSIPITSAVRRLVYVQYPDRTEKITNLTLEELNTNWEALGDCAYLSGASLHIKHQYLASTFKLSYYTSPTAFLTDGSDDLSTNWITELCPGLVEDMLAAYILNLKGEQGDSKRISELAAVFKSTYIQDFVASIG